MRSVRETVFGVDFDATWHLARYARAEVVSPLVYAGIHKAAAERDADVRACAPPGPEPIARRTRNCRGTFQVPRAMVEARPDEDVTAPQFGDRHIDDWI